MKRGSVLVEPGIRRLPDGRYEARVTRTVPGEGRRDSAAIFDRIGEARAFRAAFRARRIYERMGAEPPPGLLPRPTLKRILDAYVAECRALGLEPSTIRALEGLCRTICKALGPARPVPLTRSDLITFATWARAHTKTRGDLIARAFVVIRTAHKRAGLPRPEAPEVRFERGRRLQPSRDVAIRFVDALEWGSAERTAAELILFTAARLVEVCRLTVADVDFKAGVLTTETRKGPKGRRRAHVPQPITPELRRVLLAAIPPGAKPDLPLVRVRGHAIVDAAPLRKRLQKASVRAGLDPHITSLNWLRNFALSELVAHGRELQEAADQAGHATPRTTLTHYISDEVKRVKAWEERKEMAGVLAVRRRLPVPLSGGESPTGGAVEGQNGPVSGSDSAPDAGGSGAVNSSDSIP